MKKIREYSYKEYTDDLVKSDNQDYKLPENYVYINNSFISKLHSNLSYIIAKIFGLVYCRGILRIKIKNKKILKQYKKTGYFIYGNHTQTIGDVFIPALASNKKRIYTVVSPANLGLKGIGKILPRLGAIPVPQKISKMKSFYNAINTRINQKKCVVIYPEAHVWPYYTKIRPYKNTAFKFPVNLNVPSFCMTTTYQKRKYTNKPKITVYIDGPFFPEDNLLKDEKIEKLHNEIYDCMKKRSAESNYEYISYKKEENA